MAVLPLTIHHQTELIARQSHGRLLALLLKKHADIMAAEDALAEAFAQAVQSWAQQGIPTNPQAWLYRVASNWLINHYRSARYKYTDHTDDAADIAADHHTEPAAITTPFPDRRLALLFICAHPAIDAEIRTPLMLQTILGVSSCRIALAYSVSEAGMTQRLVRAKRRIRDARIPFVEPDKSQWPDRLAAVLEAIYGAYAIDWLEHNQVGSLADETLYLAALITELMPEEAEVWGLASLLSFSYARHQSRFSAALAFVPLDQQNWQLWDKKLITQGEVFLTKAHSLGKVGRFQLEAAIQSAHCAPVYQQSVNWQALKTLYLGLIRISPSLGAKVALSVSIFQLDGAQAALLYLDSVKDQQMLSFQPWWATMAFLHRVAGEKSQANLAYTEAIRLTTQQRLTDYLTQQVAALNDLPRHFE